MRSFRGASWPDLQDLRTEIARLQSAPDLVQAAQGLVRLFSERFDTVVLARLFAVLPLAALPEREREFARVNAPKPQLGENTPVLCLLGSAGREPAWNDRTLSRSHLAIPLASASAVQGAPMIAQLLSDLQVPLAALDAGRPIASRELLGGRSRTFFVPDAPTATDAQGRLIIAATEFASAYGVRSVFGTGGAYVDGTLVVAIFFCAEQLDREVADRFASFISAFKLATARLVQRGQLFGS